MNSHISNLYNQYYRRSLFRVLASVPVLQVTETGLGFLHNRNLNILLFCNINRLYKYCIQSPVLLLVHIIKATLLKTSCVAHYLSVIWFALYVFD